MDIDNITHIRMHLIGFVRNGDWNQNNISMNGGERWVRNQTLEAFQTCNYTRITAATREVPCRQKASKSDSVLNFN